MGRLRGNIALFGAVVLLALLTGRHAENTGHQEDVLISVQQGDTRLFVTTGYSRVALGIPPEQQSDAKARCGIRSLEGFMDVTHPEPQDEFQQLQIYASKYNQLMLPHCTRANTQ